MDENNATALFDQLWGIKQDGPGQNPEALNRARGILYEWKTHLDGYIREKAVQTERDFEVWFSVRRWNKSRDRGQHARTNLGNSMSSLQGAIESLAQRKRQDIESRSAGPERPSAVLS